MDSGVGGMILLGDMAMRDYEKRDGETVMTAKHRTWLFGPVSFGSLYQIEAHER